MAASFFAFLLATVALFAIVAPLAQRVGRKDGRPSPAGQSRVQQLLDQRETFLQGTRELETDHALGDLGHQEYQLLRADYERQMAGVLKELDSFDLGLDERIEAEIAAVRALMADGVETASVVRSAGAFVQKGPSDPAPGKAGR